MSSNDDQALVAKYGVCVTCGAPRDVWTLADAETSTLYAYLVCTADDNHDPA